MDRAVLMGLLPIAFVLLIILVLGVIGTLGISVGIGMAVLVLRRFKNRVAPSPRPRPERASPSRRPRPTTRREARNARERSRWVDRIEPYSIPLSVRGRSVRKANPDQARSVCMDCGGAALPGEERCYDCRYGE
jgi:hypothetical protein